MTKASPTKTGKTTTRRPSAKTVGKKPASNLKAKPVRPPASSKKSKDTLASVKAQMEDVLKRLNEADKLTQKSVSALKQSLSTLEKRVSSNKKVDNAALSTRVDQLSKKLTGLIAQTQQEVSKDLQSVLDDPTTETLSKAIEKADARVTQAEHNQAQALAKVNLHIASLAKVIDARLTEGQAALSDMENRIQGVEDTTATAISDLGERVVSLSTDMQVRNENVTDKVSDIAAQTQKDFDDYRAKLERRMEAIEDTQRQQDSFSDRTVETLTTRLDSLEYGLSSVTQNRLSAMSNDGLSASQNMLDDPFAPAPEPEEIAPEDDLSSIRDQDQNLDQVEPLSKNIDEITPDTVPEPADEIVPEPAPEPEIVSEPVADTALEDLYQPTITSPSADDYQPRDIVSSLYEPVTTPLESPTHTIYPQTSTTPIPDDVQHLYIASDNPLPSDLVDDLPYDDPAYAETDSAVTLDRPGGFETQPQEVRKKSVLTSRNLRVAGLAITVSFLGYLAIRGFNGTQTNNPNENLATTGTVSTQPAGQELPVSNVPGNNVTQPVGQGSSNAGPVGSAPLAGLPSPAGPANPIASTNPTTETIGQYSDNQGLTQAGMVAPPQTLQDAVNAGNPIAEFQLGLSHLQAGKTRQGVDLIRSSANKGQPAAQYRLAKLYETGEGVEADQVMARQLTERAARAGNRIAMHDLALYFAEGRGDVDVDIGTAAQWFEKAAERGVVDSQFNLGVLFESGQGLPKNPVDAFVWYSIAANQGDQFAEDRVEVLRAQVSGADLAKAERRINSFRPSAIDEAANGIFPDIAWTVPHMQLDGAPARHIREVQILLTELGYDAGGSDGMMGPKTRSAIIGFQRRSGLQETGQVDLELIQALQTASGA